MVVLRLGGPGFLVPPQGNVDEGRGVVVKDSLGMELSGEAPS